MKKLFIHIGTHKTGTTAFQHALMKNESELLHLDGLVRISKGNFVFGKRLRDSETYNSGLTQEVLTKILEIIKNDSKFIISDEQLSGMKVGRVYSNTEIIAKTLKSATKGIETHIIVMLRRQDELIQSLFTQQKHLGERIKLSEFMSELDLDCLDWNNFLNPWVECFGDNNVHVLPYDRSVFSRYSIVGLLNTVIRSTVLEKLENNDIIRKNVGYSPAASTIAESINPKLSASQRKILRRILQEVGNKGVLEEYNILQQDEKQGLVDHFYESNSELAKKYFYKPFGMSNFSDPVFAQNKKETEEDVLMRAVIELINNLEMEQHKTKQFPLNVVSGVYNRVHRFLNR